MEPWSKLDRPRIKSSIHMNEEITMALDDAKEKMDKAIGRLEGELSR